VTRTIEVRNAPTATGAPGVGGFDGRIDAGETLTCSPGTWSPAPDSISYAWLVDGALVASQTNSTYVVRSQDAGRPIVCRVTATHGGGSTTVESGSVGGTGQPGGAPAPATGGTGGDGAGGGGTGGGGGTATGSNGPSTSTTTTTSSVSTSTSTSTTYVLGPPTNGANASNQARITLSGSSKRTLPYGRRTRTGMVLRDENGRAISGASVTVMQRLSAPGALWTAARAPLVTDADGRISWLVPAGPGRTIRFAYKANLGNTDFQSTRDLVLVVRSK
jgi:hypothetical protein